ncbi:MAG: flavodoxin family protein [Planctomycetota bacterium]|nr:flavodoxin family protein [Planctomycetota bacterium]
MAEDLTRRALLGVAGAAAVAGAASEVAAATEGKEAPKGGPIKIVGLSCSPRKGKTTAAALQVCLDAAKAVGPNIEVELIELAGLNIHVFDPAAPGSGDFDQVAAKLTDPKVAGIILGTPVYFSGMSSLCKAFLDQCMACRKNNFALANKVAGVLAVGGVRNGGQELTIQSVQAALLCQEMIVVGDARPTGHSGATLLNTGDDITGDEVGLATAKNLGRRVAEVALRIAGTAK